MSKECRPCRRVVVKLIRREQFSNLNGPRTLRTVVRPVSFGFSWLHVGQVEASAWRSPVDAVLTTDTQSTVKKRRIVMCVMGQM
jgi:hypothetical protein